MVYNKDKIKKSKTSKKNYIHQRLVESTVQDLKHLSVKEIKKKIQ